jgi:predicted permease
MMSGLLQDIRYALRAVRGSPGMTFVIVTSLALGIGANTAIFSVVNALLIKPLPYPDPERLAVIWIRNPGINIPQDWPSPGQYIDIQNQQRSFEQMSISRGRVTTLLGRSGNPLVSAENAQSVETLETSSSLFPLLGAKPLYGRFFRPEEDRPGQPLVVILSYRFWSRVFNEDPSVIGKTISLNGLGGGSGETKSQYEVIGVLSQDFLLNEEIMPTVASIREMEIFVPLPFAADAVTARRFDENYNVMVRLKPDVTMEQARKDVFGIAGKIRERDKRDRAFTLEVVPLVESVVGNVRLAVVLLLGSVALVLLIACANVANLLLTRATGRQKEVAVRTALGASWKRLVAQLLTESTLLGLAGGAAGLLVALAALQIVRSINPGNIPRLEAISLDGTVLAFTFGVSVLTGILFGLAPAIWAARVDLNTSLRAGGRNTQGEGGFGARRLRLRGLLVVAEVAISLVLLIGAGLLVKSFVRLQSTAPGFQPEGVISMRLGAQLGASGRQFQNRDEYLAHFRPLGEALAALPGVTMRGAVTSLPFTSSVGWGSINVEGWIPAPGQELQVDIRGATPGYFQTMKIPLVQGRFFGDADLPGNAERVAIIDEKFARRFWPNGDAISKQIWFNPKQRIKIVGVVGSVKQYGLDIESRIVVYMPTPDAPWHVARVTGDPDAVGATIVRKIRELDPTMTVVDVQTMADRMSASMARQRFSTLMLGSFAAFALLLAIVGIYGVMSHLVTQGAHDIGVRMALGAEGRSILLMVLRQGLALTIGGVVIGVVGAYGVTRVMANLLFGVSTTDLMTFATVPLILTATATLAICIPALRATRVDPVVALRAE